jgi:hypothetical protein
MNDRRRTVVLDPWIGGCWIAPTNTNMGCTQSRPDDVDVASQEAAEGVSPADVAAVVVEKAMDLAEEVELSEVDFSLTSLPIVNPSLQSFSASSSIAWLKEVVDGTKFEISMTAPIEFVVRCMCNTAMKRMKGTVRATTL